MNSRTDTSQTAVRSQLTCCLLHVIILCLSASQVFMCNDTVTEAPPTHIHIYIDIFSSNHLLISIYNKHNILHNTTTQFHILVIVRQKRYKDI